jgi:hypothetical protein
VLVILLFSKKLPHFRTALPVGAIYGGSDFVETHWFVCLRDKYGHVRMYIYLRYGAVIAGPKNNILHPKFVPHFSDLLNGPEIPRPPTYSNYQERVSIEVNLDTGVVEWGSKSDLEQLVVVAGLHRVIW